jgi:hypothetical protein
VFDNEESERDLAGLAVPLAGGLDETGTADPRAAGDALVLELPVVPVRPLSHYAIGGPS